MKTLIGLSIGLCSLLHLTSGMDGQMSGGMRQTSRLQKSKRALSLRGGSSASFTAAAVAQTHFEEGYIHSHSPLALTCAHWMTTVDCLHSFRVNENVGLSAEEAALRQTQFGRNALQPPPKVPLWHLIAEQFQDRLVQILLGVAVLSSFLAAIEKDLHAFTEPVIIISILAVNAAVGVWQSKSAEDSLEALKKLQPETACVLRDGVWMGDFPAANIVPGDIIYLRVGDKVPADARLLNLKTTTFSTDESTLTGESATVSKSIEPTDAAAGLSAKTNMVYSGTMIANGGSYAVVTGTGMGTEIGKINAGVLAASVMTVKTPLAQKLDEFSAQLTRIIGVICVTVWLVSMPKFGSPVFGSWIKGAVYHAKIAVALGVAAIPEGLPAVITLCLSLGTRRMAKRNVVVRKLPSVETLGCTSVICTDKTGTLTTNQMTVKALVTFSAPPEEEEKEEEEAVVEEVEVVTRETDVEVEIIEVTATSAIEDLSAEQIAASGTAQAGPVPNIEEEWPWEEVDSETKVEVRVDMSSTTSDIGAVSPFDDLDREMQREIEREEEEVDQMQTIEAIEIVERQTVRYEHSTPPAPKEKEVKAHKPVAVRLDEREVDGVSYEPLGAISGMDGDSMKLDGFRDMAAICSLCNDAQLECKDGQYSRIGEPTEAALKVLVEKMGVDGMMRDTSPQALIRQCNDHWGGQYQKLAVLEFDRDRKSMSVLCRAADGVLKEGEDGRDKNRLFVKGAAEVLVTRCNRMKLADGRVVPITPEIRVTLNYKIDDMARKPLRNLALAYREGRSLEGLGAVCDIESALSSAVLKDPGNFVRLETDMVLVGFCGIKDPARPEVAEAILKCTRAAVRIMMITGDSKETAVAIAREVNIFGILEDVTDSAYTSRDFFALPMETQLKVLKKGNKVFCRAEPKDKQILISMLEKLGEVTAMTGDGVNDASALKQADIGIAMGITGTEVAKAAADMILVDDNFASIVSAVEEGRNIYSNMQTFVTFLISCNIGEIATIFIATILGLPEPLTPLHLLWVNLVTDGPPATALGFNPPDPDAMKKSPRPRSESILSRWLIIRYMVTGLYVGFATIGVFVWWYNEKGVPFKDLSRWVRCTEWTDFTHSASAPNWPEQPCDIFTAMKSTPQTMSLSVLVTIELLKALSAVSLDSSLLRVQPWQNPWLIPGVLIPYALHLLVVYCPPLSRVLGLSPLTMNEWKVVWLFASPIVLLEEVLKYVGRNKAQLKEAAFAKFKEAQAHAPHRPKLPPPMF